MSDQKTWLHGLGLCVECKSRDAYTMAGRWRCAECSQKAYARRKASEDPERRHKNARAWIDRQKAAGLCTRCGRRPSRPGRVSCEICASRDNRKANALRRVKNGTPDGARGSDGRCYICNRAPATVGRCCEPCARSITAHLRFAQREGDHPWKADNRIVFGSTGRSSLLVGSSE